VQTGWRHPYAASRDLLEGDLQSCARQHIGAKRSCLRSFSTGFKSGVFNPDLINAPVVNPESVNAAEIGLKSDGSTTGCGLILQLHELYKNIQFSLFGGGGFS